MNSDQPPAYQDSLMPLVAQQALRQGNKIEAIKILREERRLGLKEAKDLVDQYVASQPALRAQFEEAQSTNLRSGLLWLVGLAVLAVLGYYLLNK